MAAHYFLVFFFKAVPTSELVGVFMGGGGGDIQIMEALPTSEPEGECGGWGVRGIFTHPCHGLSSYIGKMNLVCHCRKH